MRTRTLLLVFGLFSATAFCSTIHVPQGYPTIQQAIDNAQNGDTIIVAPGTYVENIYFKGKDVLVQSSGGPALTIIDGNQADSAVNFVSQEGSGAVIDGFTVTNGTSPHGGGVYVHGASPTVKNNIIAGNSFVGMYIMDGTGVSVSGNVVENNVDSGIYCYGEFSLVDNVIRNNGHSGIFMQYAGTDIMNNVISNNTAEGLYAEHSKLNIVQNEIRGNKSTGIRTLDSTENIEENIVEDNSFFGVWSDGPAFGAGPWLIHGNVIRNNHLKGIYCGAERWISENRISGHKGDLNGGGISCGRDCMVVRNVITGNEAHRGAGLYLFDGGQLVGGNIISDNTAGEGGGVFAPGTITSYPIVFVNNIITGNQSNQRGGGMMLFNPAVMTNNTVHGNTSELYGGGVYCGRIKPVAEYEISNTIIWGNNSGSGPELAVMGDSGGEAVVSVDFSCVEGGIAQVHVEPSNSTLNWGTNMIDADPHFVDVAEDDFHVRFTSPCREAGDNGATGLPSVDFEGDPRQGMVDIGADEFYPHLYFTGDTAPGGYVDVKIIGQPGLHVLFFLGSGVLDPPLMTKYGAWYLLPPLAGFGPWIMPVDGVIGIHASIPGGTPVPYVIPMQALVNPDLTNLSVLRIE
jgi:parallel beta-helix repeat protein